MDKIRQIVKQIGGTDELADQLVMTIEEHIEAETKRLAEEFKQKIDKAKQICLEEVAAEKVRMARKIEVFLESKAASIERATSKQRAIEESAAIATLRQIKQALGVGNDGDSAELQALQRKLARIAEQTHSLKEERDQLAKKANQANTVAVRALKRVRTLESRQTTEKPVVEEKPAEKVEDVRTESEVPQTTSVSRADEPVPSEEAAPIAAEPSTATATAPTPEDIAAAMGQDEQK